jgi:hypothetical protein
MEKQGYFVRASDSQVGKCCEKNLLQTSTFLRRKCKNWESQQLSSMAVTKPVPDKQSAAVGKETPPISAHIRDDGLASAGCSSSAGPGGT